MSNFEFEESKFDGVYVITPFYQEDSRGYFLKNVERDVYASHGINIDIFEEFESKSEHNVIRGLHFQTKNPQSKLVRVVQGEVYDVIVDLRKQSLTFGKYMAVKLSGDNHKSLWIPAGFAHGFKVVSDCALMEYKCVGKYEKDYDTGIRWNDMDLNIDWEISLSDKQIIVSDRDCQLMTFKEFIEKYQGL